MALPSEQYDKRAFANFEKMDNPRMRKLLGEFLSEFHTAYRQNTNIFDLAYSMFNKKKGAFAIVEGRSRFNDVDYFYNLIQTEVRGKFDAVNYHFQNAKKLQEEIDEYSHKIVELARKLDMNSPITISLSTTKLQLEYESFILQCRACLDHFVYSVSYYFGFSPTSDIDALKQTLHNNYSKNEKAELILGLFENSEKFYGVIKTRSRVLLQHWSDRDKIAHSGLVSFIPLNIIIIPNGESKILPLARGEKKLIHADMFTLQSLISFMDKTMTQLFDFIISIYGVLLDEEKNVPENTLG